MNVTRFNERSSLRSFVLGRDYGHYKELDGRNLTVAIAEMPPYVILHRDERGEIKQIDGYLAQLWQILEEQLNFKTIWMEIKTGYLGTLHNETWTGMIGELHAERADVGLANFGINSERQKVLDFSAAIDFDTSKLLMFSDVNKQNVDWLTFMTTLSWKIWCCVLGIWLLASLLLGFMARLESDGNGFLEYSFYLFSAITYQGCEVLPKKICGRIVVISFWLMSVVLNATFTALLTTNLTTATYKPLSSLEEAIEKGFYVSILRGSQQHHSIITSGSQTFMKISEDFKEYPSLVVETVDEGIETTHGGYTLFLYDSNMLGWKTFRNCSYRIQRPDLFTGYTHLAYRKHFQFQEILNYRIIRLMASGIQDKLRHSWMDDEDTCNLQNGEIPSLGLNKTMFAFLIVLIGIASSLAVLLVEMYLGGMPCRTAGHKLISGQNLGR